MSDPVLVHINEHPGLESAVDATVEVLPADAAVVVLRGESAEANTPAAIEELFHVATRIHASHPAHPVVIVLPFGVEISTAKALDSAALGMAIRAASDNDLAALGLVRVQRDGKDRETTT